MDDTAFLMENSKKMHPIQVDVFLYVTHLLFFGIGIPVNVFIAFFMVLWRHPRNIFLLGLILSNLTNFFPVVLQLIYAHWPSEWLCHMYVASSGPLHLNSLSALLWALVDRLVALTHPQWRRRHVSVARVAFLLVFNCVSLTLLVQTPFLSGLVQLRCEFDWMQTLFYDVILGALLVSCIAVEIAVYRRTKMLLDQFERDEVAMDPAISAPDFINLDSFSDAARVADPPVDESHLRLNNEQMCRLETEATFTLVIVMFTLCFLELPVFIHLTMKLVFDALCENCPDPFPWLGTYFSQLCVLNAVIHSILFVACSDEFSLALRGFFSNV